MQGNNILGEKKRPKARLAREAGIRGLLMGAATQGLAADRRHRSRPRRVENRLRIVGEKGKDRLSLPAVARIRGG